MKHFNLHFKLHNLKSLLFCLILFQVWTMHAQNVGIGTTTPAYQLTLGGINGVLGIENTATFTAKNSSGVYEAFFWPRWSDNRTILNFGTGGLQIRDNASNVKFQILNSGFVGIGTVSPTATLHVSGNLRVEDGTQAAGKVLTSDVNGVATWQTPTAGSETDPQVASTISNCVPKWNGTALADGLIYDNGTNVGIGTTSPTGKLHVVTSGTSGYAGHIILQAPSMLATASTVLMLGKNTSTGNQAELRYTYNGDGSTDNRYEFGFANIQPFMSITAGQRVGIGTLTPSTKLDVVGQVRIQDGTQAVGKVLTSDANGAASWQTPTAGAEVDPQVSSTVTSQIPKWNGTTLTDGLVTDNGTNIGIGTTSPTGKLHVVTSGTSGYAGHIILQAPSMLATASTVLMLGKNTSTGNQAELRYTYNGDGSTDNRYEFGFANIQPFMSITAGQRVGIGTLTPSTKLDVVGQVRIQDGTQAVGKVLTSDANGAASWQTPTAGAESDPQVSSTVTSQIPKWNGTTLTDGLVTDNGTNIGIGTTSPTGKLHVVTSGTSGYAGHIILQAPSMLATASTVLMLGKNTSTGNQAELRYTYNGDGSTDNRYEFGFANIQPFMSITAGQRVGIGTLTPSTKLDVVGQVKITDGTQAVGKVLTSDASGVASWQTPTAGAETDPQVGSTVTNQIPKWNGTTLADGLITDNGTNIGIGTTSPTGKLHVVTSGTSGYAGHIILHAPSMVSTASTVLMLGKNTSTANQAELRYTYNGDGSTDNRYEFGFSNIQPFVFFTAGGKVGIGTAAPNGLFELGSDSGRKPSTSTWTITSDARVKNIEGQYSKGLNEIVQLNPIVYHYKNARNKTFSPEVLAQENVGLTAQEVQGVFPEAVGVDPDGTLNLNMHSIIIAQINAIKELNEKVEQQQVQIELLLTKMNELVNQMNPKE